MQIYVEQRHGRGPETANCDDINKINKMDSPCISWRIVLLRHVSPVGQPQGGRLPVGSSGRLGKWPLRDREILRSSRCGEYYKSFYLNYLLSLARGPVAVSSWAGAGLSIEQATVVGVVGLGFEFVGTASLACSSTILCFVSCPSSAGSGVRWHFPGT